MLLLLPLGLVAQIGLVIAVIGAVILIVRRVKDRAEWLGCVGVPLGCGFAPIVGLFLLMLMIGLFNMFRPDSWAYEEVFARAPPSAVTELVAATEAGLDSRFIFLSFDRNKGAWNAMTADRAFEALSPDSAALDGPENELPSWWRGGRWSRGHDCPGGRAVELTVTGNWDHIYLVDCARYGRIYVLATNID